MDEQVSSRRPELKKLSFPPASSPETSPELDYLRSHSTGTLQFSPNEIYAFNRDDLVGKIEIGQGNFGTVYRMEHPASGNVLAVKCIRSNTVKQTEQKRLLVELEAIMKSDCEYIVQFYGAIFCDGDCWICMELMDICLDKLYKSFYEKQKEQQKAIKFPEQIIGFIVVSTVNALSYLKDHLKIIHRDIKPSNILLDRKGHIKLCDFGIAGRLIDSIAKTQDVGCRPYMAPERLQTNHPYDVRSDVWSLGITLYEISTGKFPYSTWDSPFQQLREVVDGDPPVMPPGDYSAHLVTFINNCLIKGQNERPKYKDLMVMEFYKTYNTINDNEKEHARAIVGEFVAEAIASKINHNNNSNNNTNNSNNSNNNNNNNSNTNSNSNSNNSDSGNNASQTTTIHAPPSSNSNDKRQNKDDPLVMRLSSSSSSSCIADTATTNQMITNDQNDRIDDDNDNDNDDEQQQQQQPNDDDDAAAEHFSSTSSPSTLQAASNRKSWVQFS